MSDQFGDLARYYDRIMDKVNYERWHVITGMLAEWAGTAPLRHLDVACGTASLSKRLRRDGWTTYGVDRSHAMIAASRKGPVHVDTAVADMRALPFRGSFSLVTCLFDSLNFLLDEEDVFRAVAEMSDALSRNDGILYFDVITERMVLEHFAGQSWTEDNGPFNSTWEGVYDQRQRIASTSVTVNTGARTVIEERVYPLEQITQAVESAGLTLLGSYDAETWKAPTRKSLRIDYVAVKNPERHTSKAFAKIASQIRRLPSW